jgi:hypothetical protein
MSLYTPKVSSLQAIHRQRLGPRSGSRTLRASVLEVSLASTEELLVEEIYIPLCIW